MIITGTDVTVRIYRAQARQGWPYVKVQEMGSLCLILALFMKT